MVAEDAMAITARVVLGIKMSKFIMIISNHDNVDTLKKRIRIKLGINGGIISLSLHEQKLEDKMRVKDLNFQGKTLYIHFENEKKKIIVNTNKGNAFPLDVDPDDPVEHIKARLFDKIKQDIIKYNNEEYKQAIENFDK